jgi:hypothetical protein
LNRQGYKGKTRHPQSPSTHGQNAFYQRPHYITHIEHGQTASVWNGFSATHLPVFGRNSAHNRAARPVQRSAWNVVVLEIQGHG